jgi:hypothetical protein
MIGAAIAVFQTALIDPSPEATRRGVAHRPIVDGSFIKKSEKIQ